MQTAGQFIIERHDTQGDLSQRPALRCPCKLTLLGRFVHDAAASFEGASLAHLWLAAAAADCAVALTAAGLDAAQWHRCHGQILHSGHFRRPIHCHFVPANRGPAHLRAQVTHALQGRTLTRQDHFQRPDRTTLTADTNM